MRSYDVLLKCVHIARLMREGNDVISQDDILVVNDIRSATANVECCSVMITGIAIHHDTPSTPSIRLDKVVIVITFSTPTPTPHPQLTISISQMERYSPENSIPCQRYYL